MAVLTIEPTYIVSEVWNLMSANESGGTSTNLLGNNTGALPSSKPDFIEATRSAALRYWNSPSKEGNPEKNGYGAFEIMIQNMELHQAHTDGCMGAALTMSISERLAEDDIAWNKRMLNVADVIRERSKRGMSGLPPEFSSVAIAYVTNAPHWR